MDKTEPKNKIPLSELASKSIYDQFKKHLINKSVNFFVLIYLFYFSFVFILNL